MTVCSTESTKVDIHLRFLRGLLFPNWTILVAANGDNNHDAVLEVYLSDPGKPPVKLKKSDVDQMEISQTSQMPTQLIDALSPEELLDLVAYLLSRANANAPEFQQE